MVDKKRRRDMNVWERAGELQPTRDRLAQAIKTSRRYSRQCDIYRQKIAQLVHRYTADNNEAFKNIRTIVNMACEEACVANTIRGAINWGDLGCADVGTMNDSYYVVIEEASPDSWELVKFVYDKLAAAGYKNVDVRAEW
jgi:hypothetical protein